VGLVIFGALAIYLAVLISVTVLGYRWAAKRGRSRSKRWLAGGIGFLLVYLPLFWDHIPTVAAHKYYCEKEAGLWIYEPIEQWKRKHAGEAPTRERFTSSLRKSGPLPINQWRWDYELVDVKTGTLLAKRVDFSTGTEGRIGGEPELKFWLHTDGCDSSRTQAKQFVEVVAQFRGLEK